MLNTERITKLIEDSGMSKKDFATAIGLTESSFYAMLKRRSTKMPRLEMIAKLLGVKAETLLEGTTHNIEPANNTAQLKQYQELVIRQQTLIDQLGKQIDFLMKENQRLNSQISANGLKK